MIMMFAPNSRVRQKKGAQGVEEEETGHQVQLGQGCRMR